MSRRSGGAGIPVGRRLPVLAAGGLALLGGLYTALLRLDAPLPDTSAGLDRVHGPVLVLGFVGTLVALERAVALGATWALAAPLCSGAGAVVLLARGPVPPGQFLLCVAAVGLLGVYRALWRRQAGVALLAQAAGALCWYAATVLWLAGFPVGEVVPWLAGFVLLTIAGERLELSRVGLIGDGRAHLWFAAACGGVLAAAPATVLWPRVGYPLWGLAVLGLAAWLAVFDVARRLIRSTGLPRYSAAGLILGYGWLAVAGLVWTGGPVFDGPRYDAALHAVFLGFTMSMIFVHAPVILPAVLRRPLPYHAVLYGPLALLHVSLAARLGLGDLAGLTEAWRWSGVANVVAIVTFVACAVTLSARGRRSPRAVVARAVESAP